MSFCLSAAAFPVLFLLASWTDCFFSLFPHSAWFLSNVLEVPHCWVWLFSQLGSTPVSLRVLICNDCLVVLTFLFRPVLFRPVVLLQYFFLRIDIFFWLDLAFFSAIFFCNLFFGSTHVDHRRCAPASWTLTLAWAMSLFRYVAPAVNLIVDGVSETIFPFKGFVSVLPLLLASSFRTRMGDRWPVVSLDLSSMNPRSQEHMSSLPSSGLMVIVSSTTRWWAFADVSLLVWFHPVFASSSAFSARSFVRYFADSTCLKSLIVIIQHHNPQSSFDGLYCSFDLSASSMVPYRTELFF